MLDIGLFLGVTQVSFMLDIGLFLGVTQVSFMVDIGLFYAYLSLAASLFPDSSSLTAVVLGDVGAWR